MLIQIILVAIMALALVMTWRRARQRVIRVAEALGWSALWIAAAVVVLLPNTASSVASFVGVGRGADLVTYAAVALLFLLVFTLFVKHEQLERNLTDLVRREALRDLEEGTDIVAIVPEPDSHGDDR